MKVRLIAAAVFVSIPAAASAMPVATFLAKAQTLRAKGVRALFSSDYKLLTNAIKADADALRSEREAAKAAKRTPPYCPPGPVKISSKEILDAMNAVPAGERQRTDSRDALRAYFARRFPCRG